MTSHTLSNKLYGLPVVCIYPFAYKVSQKLSSIGPYLSAPGGKGYLSITRYSTAPLCRRRF